MNARAANAIEPLFSDTFIEHNADCAAGVQGFLDRNADFFTDAGIVFEVVECFEDGEGNVAAYVKAKKNGVTAFRTADIYTVENGLIKEHWSMRQQAV